jgi:hypothetical protein
MFRNRTNRQNYINEKGRNYGYITCKRVFGTP